MSRLLVCYFAALTTLISIVTSQQLDSAALARRRLALSATPGITDVQLYEPEHYSTTTLSGGRGGGTRLRLLGNNLLNPDGSFDTSITVSVGGQPATLVPFFSTSKQLVVDTPPKSPQSPDCCHIFEVFNRNGKIKSEVSESKRFTYEERLTPYLHGIVPSVAAPGDEVRIVGSFRWWRLRMDSYSPENPKRLVRTADIGPYRCLLPWSDDPEDVELDDYQSSLPCRIPDNVAPGYYNVSVTFGDVFGTTVPWKPFFEIPQPGSSTAYSVNTYWPSLSSTPGVHMLQILPRIDGMSVHAGSIAGGQLVNIGGRGLGKDRSAIRVDIAGAPCKLVHADDNNITCITAVGNDTAQPIYRGGAGVLVDHYQENDRTLDESVTVNSSTIAAHMNMPYNTSLYRVRMDTIFTPHFTGVGYFVGAYDDFADMRLTKLNADGEIITDYGLVISSDYPGRGWSRVSGQRSNDFNFTRGELYRIVLDHGNVGGAGYFNLALVHRGAPPSWSSERGEQHTISVSCDVVGETQQIELGPLINGTFRLEIGYTDIDGSRQVSQTGRIDAKPTSLYTSVRAASGNLIRLTIKKSVLDSGHTTVTVSFSKPSFDGAGHVVTVRNLNATCSGECTARSGDVAEVVQREGSFDWNTTLSISWNGTVSPISIPSYLIDSARSAVDTEVLAVLQAVPGVPAAFNADRQAGGGLHARVSGNIFSGAQIIYTWPAPLGPLTPPSQSSNTSVPPALSVEVVGSDNGQYEVSTSMDPAITDAWHFPIAGSVFSLPETEPQVVVHVNGLRAMCRTNDSCSYMHMSNQSALLSDVQVNGANVVVTGSGFGAHAGDGGLVPPVSIGSVSCNSTEGSWTDTEIRCTLATQLLPGSNIVKVHVPGQGYAMQQSGQPFIISTQLDSPITTASQGSLGGGWPLAFVSPSSQLGERPGNVYVRFSREANSSVAEVYMLPDPDGDTQRLHALLCTSTGISRDAPVPAFLGLAPIWGIEDVLSASLSGQNGEADSAGTSVAQAERDSATPAQSFAALFNITGLSRDCLYYAGNGLQWSLQQGELIIPAPPSTVFTALLSSTGRESGTSSRRRLAQESDSVPSTSAALFVNSQNVSSMQMAYDSSAAPNITSVVPSTISAAASQVIEIHGEGFSGNVSDTLVWLGSRGCYVRTVSAVKITCRARGGGTFGTLSISVKTGGVFAGGDVSVTGVLYISAISRAYGSLAGGSVLEISGEGFADELGIVTTNFVSIGLPPAAPCRVLSATQNRIVCQTEPAGRMHTGAIPERLNPLEVSVNGIYAQCRAPAVCTPGCKSTAAAESGSGKCCSFDVPDPANTELMPFIGDDQQYGADNCSFYYTRHATANVTAFSAVATAADGLLLNGSMLNTSGVYAVPLAAEDVSRWINPYSEDNLPEAVMLPNMWAEGGAQPPGLRALTVTESNLTHITAAIPEDLVMGLYQIVVWAASSGAAVMPTLQDPLLRVNAQMVGIEPSSLPSSGGLVRITGTGFPGDREKVMLEGKGQQWLVVSSNATSITAYSQGMLSSNLASFSLSTSNLPADCAKQMSACPPPIIALFNLEISAALAEIVAFRQEGSGAEAVLTVQTTAEAGMTTQAYLAEHSVMVMFGLEQLTAEVNIINETTASITIAQGTIAELPASPGSGHPIYVIVDGNTTAGLRPSVHVPLTISSVSPELGSHAGGTELTITGSGFSNSTDGTTVSICHMPCSVTLVPSTSELRCVTSGPALDTGILPVAASQVTGSGTSYEQSLYPARLMFDGSSEGDSKWRSSTGGFCEFIVDWYPFETELTLLRILIPAELAKQSTDYEPQSQLQSMTIDVSPNATDGSWQTVGDGSSAAPFATGWTDVNLNATSMQRYVRVRLSKSRARCAVAEAVFEGRMTPLSGVENCNINATVATRSGNTVASLAHAYSFALNHTPIAAAVTPAYGTAAGGTTVTISGAQLPASTADAVVEIDGVECTVTSATTQVIECVTGARPVIPSARSFRVRSRSKGDALLTVPGFMYKDLWSSRVTWAGEPPPMEGESVVIPAGQSILFDLPDSPRLRLLLVEGQLEFLDSADVHLHAEWIMVRGEGSALTIGREEAPFSHRATVTLHGRRASSRDIPSYGAKNIAVRYGTLDLHGQPKTPTWTRLGATAVRGAISVRLAEAVNWQPGDAVVIASSAWDPSEVEKRRIVAVSSDQMTLTLDRMLWFQHWGELVEVSGRTIDMRAEIGCLSRNVLIQGDEESDTDQYGAHIMLSSPPRGRLATTIGRISQIECFRCGQAFMLGRYPLHFHMMGDVHDSYIRGAAVHRTFNRAVTIHGVHYLRIEDVVAFDNMGHTFFIEDAIESQNRIVHNLALWTRKSMSLLDTDTTPASFWITFPTNYFYNNSAAGSERYGFWFDLQKNPTGPSHTTDICPPGEPLGAFEDNTAHSNVRYGLRIFNFWVPLAADRDACGWSKWWKQRYPRTATLLRYTGYKNGRTGLMMSRAGDVRCEECALIDNMRAGAELNRMDGPYGTTGTYNTIIGVYSPAMTGRTFPHWLRDDPDSPFTYGWIVSGFTNDQVVSNTTFWGFKGSSAFALSTCDHCNFPNSKNQGAKTTHFANITYIDTENYILYGERLNAILHDMDGSLSGYPAGTHLTYGGWTHLNTVCPVGDRPGWTTSRVCPLTKRLVRVMIDRAIPSIIYRDVEMVVQLAPPPALETLRPQNMDHAGSSRSMVEYGGIKLKDVPNGWAVVLATDEHYHLWWDTINQVPENLRFESTDMLATSRANTSFPEGIVLTLPYDDVWPYVGVKGPAGESEATDLGLVDSRVDNTGDSYRSYENNTLSLMFSGRSNPDRGWWWREQVTAYGARCPPEGCPPPEQVTVDRSGPIRKWSNRTIWETLPEDERPRLDPSTGMPAAGADVSVPATWRLELDTNTPSLGHLDLDGLLLFSRGSDVELSVESLKMTVGAMQAGTESRPHDGKVTIRITGETRRASTGRRLSAVGGSNILEMLGEVSLHGTSSMPQQTHLAAPASPGDIQITLTDPAQWRPGEEVFLTSTGFDWQAAEYAIVSACNGTAVTLQAPLRYSHFGAPDLFRDDAISNKTKFEGLENRAQVLLLTRSITVEGGGGERDGKGAKILVTELEVQREERGVPTTFIYQGTLDVSNVAFRGMGQAGTARAALTVLSTSEQIALHSCTFSRCYGPGIDVRSAGFVNMTNNIILDTEGPAVWVWNDRLRAEGLQLPAEPRVELVNNTAGFARKLGNNVRTDPVSGFVMCAYSETCVVKAEGNVVAGTENYGFVFGRTDKCGEDDSDRLPNRAHSCRVGFVYLSANSSECSRISNAIALHTTEIGLVYDREGMNMEVEHLLLSDNRVGMAVMPGAKRAIADGYVSITRSAAIGSSNNGGCGFDDGSACPAVCGRGGFPNYTEEGNAACGPRIGFTTAVWWNNPKSWPRQFPIMGPWWDIDRDASLGGHTRFHDIALVNWPQSDICDCRHFAITPNPSADDLSPTAFVSGVAKSNVAEGAQYHPPPADRGRATFDNCVDFECTGLSHSVLVDTDGSLMGAPASVIRGDTSLAINDTRAVSSQLMDAIIVSGGAYRELYFESMDPDRKTRRVQPVQVTGVGAEAGRGSTARLNCFEDHLWDFDYTSLLRLSRFATTVELGGNYTITYAGTPPQQQQISMSGNAPDEGVLVRIKYYVAQTFKIQVKGEQMRLPSIIPVTLSDPAGSNHWDMSTFELTIVVKGSQPILLRQLPMVRISMALEMDVETFLETPTATFTSGLAFALQLDPSTIRVAGYRSRGNRRRLANAAATPSIELTFAAIPEAELADDPGTTPLAGEAGAEDVVEVFDATSVRALSAAVAAATAAVEEIEIAGIAVATSSLVAEVQEPVAADCSPMCKAADNGVAPSCVDLECVCTAEGYTYYDATSDGLNATQPSGCYVPYPSPGTSEPPAANTVTRSAVLMTVRFTEMTLNQASTSFERALCDVATARISAVLESVTAVPEPLGCSVATRSGSVIAEATVVMPASASVAAMVAAANDLSSNVGADITANAVLGVLGAFDAPTAMMTTVVVVPVVVLPVIADGVSLTAPAGMLARREGAPVTLDVTFTQTPISGLVSTVDVTGFAADDVEASAQAPDGESLPLAATVVEVSPARYQLRLDALAAVWPPEALQNCDDWTVSVGVVERAAVSANGETSTMSATAQLMWRPALDDVCDSKDDSDGGINGALLGGVLGGILGFMVITGIVALLCARYYFRGPRVGLADSPGDEA